MARLILLASLCACLAAQELKRPTLVSPDVLGDGRVTLRLWAPKAVEVLLSGDWMGPQPPSELLKGVDGTWTITIGPLEPNIYTYGFLVDGVRASDPSCRCSLTSAGRFSSSKFTITGSSANSWDDRNTTLKGALHYEPFFSKQLQRPSRAVVYTPPDYRQSPSRRYPVLVLLPGTPGDENDWTIGGGFAHTMFDNLIADGKIPPMLVVMHASDILPSGTRAAHLVALEPALLNDLLPEIRKRYRVEQKPESWAIAGLSLGGEYAMTIGLRHPELFRTVASMSGSIIERDFDDRFGKALNQPEKLKRDYRLIWIGCGDGDIFLPGNKAFAAKLASANVPHTFREFSGTHAMPVFRRQLSELLPKLFR